MDLAALGSCLLEDVVDPAPVLERETVFDGRVWDIVRETVTFGGAPMTREYMEHPGAVVVATIDAHERMLVINQYRHPIGMRDWELPAGLLDVAGEDKLAAAQRELAEDLNTLLNTINLGSAEDLSEFSYVGRSILNYGLTDITGYSIEENGSDALNYKLNLSWSSSTLNRGLFPTAGRAQSLGLEVAVPGSDLQFYKLSYNGQIYFPIAQGWSLRLRTELGFGDGSPFPSAADAGFLFHAPQNVIDEFPGFPAVDDYDELLTLISAELS